ncbi:MAG: Glucokinase [Syntrophus sp. SKADARSKE-3]|nr:Glucokinase [Syntrophus sp. SKADARSKE-3]
MKTILAGDIGGTKTTLGLFSPTQGPRHPLETETYASAAFNGLAPMVGDFLVKTGRRVDAATFGMAGPVKKGRGRLTNLPWDLDEEDLSEKLHIPAVRLMNDLVAMAGAIPLLSEGEDLISINTGDAATDGNRAIIAPGTGLGEAFAIKIGTEFRTLHSEGGHCDFGPRNSLEWELMHYLQEKNGHVSYESLCSGPGIRNIYLFLKGKEEHPNGCDLSGWRSQTDDLTPWIVEQALATGEPNGICYKTIEIFMSILGAEAGNLALKVLATGGVYVGGGIPRRIHHLLSKGAFMSAFIDKGRFAEFMSLIPVRVILNADAALFGAAARGLALIS